MEISFEAFYFKVKVDSYQLKFVKKPITDTEKRK